MMKKWLSVSILAIALFLCLPKDALAADIEDDEDVDMGTSDAGDGGWDEL